MVWHWSTRGPDTLSAKRLEIAVTSIGEYMKGRSVWYFLAGNLEPKKEIPTKTCNEGERDIEENWVKTHEKRSKQSS